MSLGPYPAISKALRDETTTGVVVILGLCQIVSWSVALAPAPRRYTGGWGKALGVYLKLMGFGRCKGGRPSGIRHWTLSTNMPAGRSPMRQDTTSALAGLASFAKLQDLLAARSQEGCAEGKMTFEAFEVALGHAVRGLENELKAADLARYDVEATVVMVDG